MSRNEFSKPTKRAALKRSGWQCEAVGSWYGLPEGERCNASLAYGVQFDHVDLDANSHDNSLENCAAVCPKCHHWKTTHRDIPLAAKTLRQQDKHLGIKQTSRPMACGRNSPWKRTMNGKTVPRQRPRHPSASGE